MKNLLPFVFALGTAICWGLYGPTLGRARIADADLSPFKPYVAIGFAYLVIAIVGGMAGMAWKGDSFAPSGAGAGWGLAAGTLGALGAFNLTLAMFTGGARIPHAVMPVVFGGAVTVTALYAVVSSRGKLHTTPMLWVGILLMLVAVIIITRNTPHAAPAAAPTPGSEAPAAASADAEH
ncbi:MAG TPA: hypothetical protein VMT85_09495 [Thermoanaerobaculia bacterium]|nr:hypothetical protein [Thermoanaerobaculia bacterium]